METHDPQTESSLPVGSEPALPPSPPAAGVSEAERQQLINATATVYNLEAVRRGGASWFYTIAILSLVNSLAVWQDWNFQFLAGMSVTLVIDVLGKMTGQLGSMLAIPADLAVALFIGSFGWMARRGMGWAFLVGMGLYGLDTLISLAIGDWLNLAFHVWALSGIWQGYKAHRILAQTYPGAAPSAG